MDFGICALVLTPGIVDWAHVWPWTKAVCVFWRCLDFHGWLGAQRKAFAAGGGVLRQGGSYRIMNEVPTVLMIVIVLSVVVKF